MKDKEVKKTTDTYSKSTDNRIIEWKQGSTFKGRLIYWYPDGGQRKEPFILQYKHSFWDKETKERGDIICPTSEYLSDRNGFNQCPVCQSTNEFYKDYNVETKTWNSPASSEMYRHFKRSFHGYALVYVVNDPANEDNNGHVRILRFGDTIAKFLKKKIFGVERIKGKLTPVSDQDDVIAFSAFDLENGYNLNIAISANDSNPQWNVYSPEFARKTSNIGKTIEELEAEIKTLNFDRDFYRSSSPEEIKKFHRAFVLRQSIDDEVEAAGDECTPPEEDDGMSSKPSIPAPPLVPKVEKPVEKKAEIKPEAKAPVASKTSVDMSDINDLLGELGIQ